MNQDQKTENFSQQKEVSTNHHFEEEKNFKSEVKASDRISWKMTIFLLLSTILISLIIGYFISLKFIWKNDNEIKLAERLDKYEALVASDPNDPNYRVELGFTFYLKENYNKAIKQFKTAISLDKEYYPAHLNLAITYFEIGEVENALEEATISKDLAPRDYKSKLIMGRCYRSMKMYDDSKEALIAAQNLASGNVEVIYEIGRLAEDQGEKKKAEEIFREALSYDPNYKEAREALDRVTK